jgi:chemotaxis protein histidine kinase CheA
MEESASIPLPEPEKADEPAEIAIETPAPADTIDTGLQQVMKAEIQEHLNTLQNLVDGLNSGADQPVDTGMVRAAHTLAGTFAMAPVGQEADVARALERYLEDLQKKNLRATASAITTLQICLHRFCQRLSVLEDGVTTSYPLTDEQLLADVAALSDKEASTPEISVETAAADEQAVTDLVPEIEETPEDTPDETPA